MRKCMLVTALSITATAAVFLLLLASLVSSIRHSQSSREEDVRLVHPDPHSLDVVEIFSEKVGREYLRAGFYAVVQLRNSLSAAQKLCICVRQGSRVSFKCVLGLGQGLHPVWLDWDSSLPHDRRTHSISVAVRDSAADLSRWSTRSCSGCTAVFQAARQRSTSIEEFFPSEEDGKLDSSPSPRVVFLTPRDGDSISISDDGIQHAVVGFFSSISVECSSCLYSNTSLISCTNVSLVARHAVGQLTLNLF